MGLTQPHPGGVTAPGVTQQVTEVHSLESGSLNPCLVSCIPLSWARGLWVLEAPAAPSYAALGSPSHFPI